MGVRRFFLGAFPWPDPGESLREAFLLCYHVHGCGDVDAMTPRERTEWLRQLAKQIQAEERAIKRK